MPAAVDVSGQRFGRLVALSVASTGKRRKWLCQCDCGASIVVATDKLRSGHTSSCGCLKSDTCAGSGRKGGSVGGRSKARTTHGRSNGKCRTWNSWKAMKCRCRDVNNPDYGGRGITYCNRWESFENFLEDMGDRPEGMTLDCIDPDDNYGPENCRWAPVKRQHRNKRRTRYLYVDDEPKSIMDIADELGIKKSAMQYFYSVAKLLEDEYGYLPSVKNGGTYSR